MTYAYTGKILNIDLSSGKIEKEELGEDIYKKFLGGYGLGVKIIYDRQPAGTDPLGEESILGFTPGLLTGTKALFSGRYMVAGKSPLTGGWGDANAGGTIGPEIKSAGYDAIFVKGISQEPVYIWINDDKVEIKNANHLWGKSTVETEEQIVNDLKVKGVKVISIGEAGEKLSLISGIVNDKGRIAARSGLGAVMGSKRLKALAINGTQPIPLFDRDLLNKLNKEFSNYMNKGLQTRLLGRLRFGPIIQFMGKVLGRIPFHTKMTPVMMKVILEQYGTAAFTAFYNGSGEAPSKNWKGSAGINFSIPQSSKISDEEVIKYQTKKYHCRSWPC